MYQGVAAHGIRITHEVKIMADDIRHIDTKEEVAAYGIKTLKEILLNKTTFKRFLRLLLVSALAGGMIIGVIYAVKTLI